MGILCKIFGSVCIMGAAGYFAINVNYTMEMRKQELRSLYSILLQLKSEIQYMCNPLPESFLKIAKGAKHPFSLWLIGMVEALEKKTRITFCDVWRNGLEHLYHLSYLEKEDIEPLKELSDKLGSGDVAAQLKIIDYALLHIEENRIHLEEELEQKKKVTVTLSMFCGAMMLIILL